MKHATASLFVGLVLLAGCGTVPATSPPGHVHTAPAVSASKFHAVEDGVAVASQPSDDALRDAASKGYRTVVNLRTDGESHDSAAEGRLVASLGMRYVRIPVASGGVTDEQAARLAEALAGPEAEPVLVHCASGQRAAALWALHLARYRGLTSEEALAEADAAGIGPDLRAALERRLLER